jgi:hypothetical protein
MRVDPIPVYIEVNVHVVAEWHASLIDHCLSCLVGVLRTTEGTRSNGTHRKRRTETFAAATNLEISYVLWAARSSSRRRTACQPS